MRDPARHLRRTRLGVTRREILRVAASSTIAPCLGFAGVSQAPAPRAIGLGPQLFLDDFLVDGMEGLSRRIESPERLGDPVLDSMTFGCTQPYMTVTHDSSNRHFRIWYNHGPAVWHAESTDGVHWVNPRVAWDLPRSYGASLVDDGPGGTVPARRFKLANWRATRSREDKPGDDGGMWVGFSPDGFHWTDHEANPVLPTWPEGYDSPTRHGVGDIVDVYRDPLAQRYVAMVKVHAMLEEGFTPGPRAGKGIRRFVGISTSADFVHWEKPRRILQADSNDDGLLEFYGIGGTHARGALRIGFARVLRDDLSCDRGGPRDGIGYSVLVTSRDGSAWHRHRPAFLDRNPLPGSWDHAMTWIGAAVPVGDELFLYYGGYARGHKVEPTRERQVGLARMKRDRYVGIVPTRDEGRLLSPMFLIPGNRLAINARAERGAIHVRLLDPLDQLLHEARVQDDQIDSEVFGPEILEPLRGKPARLEFRLKSSALFAASFEVRAANQASRSPSP